MSYSGRNGIGLVRILQINLPYHTNINKSMTSSSVDTLIPLAGKMALATQSCRGKGGPRGTRAHAHARNLPSPEALSPYIEEYAVNRPTNLPFTFPGLA